MKIDYFTVDWSKSVDRPGDVFQYISAGVRLAHGRLHKCVKRAPLCSIDLCDAYPPAGGNTAKRVLPAAAAGSG